MLGMNLKRIEVIGDDVGEIGEAARRMSENYAFVFTRQDCFLNADPCLFYINDKPELAPMQKPANLLVAAVE